MGNVTKLKNLLSLKSHLELNLGFNALYNLPIYCALLYYFTSSLNFYFIFV